MMNRRICCVGLAITFLALVATIHGAETRDDFRWMRGANYVATYAAPDVEMWLNYDHEIIDRE